MNAFGEEVIVDNTDKAIAIASEKTGAVVNDYTAAPVYFGDNNNGAHEWLIEFDKAPPISLILLANWMRPLRASTAITRQAL